MQPIIHILDSTFGFRLLVKVGGSQNARYVGIPAFLNLQHSLAEGLAVEAATGYRIALDITSAEMAPFEFRTLLSSMGSGDSRTSSFAVEVLVGEISSGAMELLKVDSHVTGAIERCVRPVDTICFY